MPHFHRAMFMVMLFLIVCGKIFAGNDELLVSIKPSCPVKGRKHRKHYLR